MSQVGNTVSALFNAADTISHGSPKRYLGEVLNFVPLLCDDIAEELDEAGFGEHGKSSADFQGIWYGFTEQVVETHYKVDRLADIINSEVEDAAIRRMEGSFRSDASIVLLDGKPIHEYTVAELRERAVPSPYGDLETQTTRVDESIRNALEIKRDMGLSLRPDFDDWSHGWADEISRKMFGGLSVRLELSKLNIYDEGCFFVDHLDTPREGVVGSFVVTFGKFPYTGGDLIVGGSPVERPTEETNSFVAFFGNTAHKVKRVESGCRMSASFYIVAADEPESSQDAGIGVSTAARGEGASGGPASGGGQADGNGAGEERLTPAARAIMEFLRETERHRIGFLLEQKYSFAEMKIGVMKGKDAHLAWILRSLQDHVGASIEAMPVTFRVVTSYNFSEEGSTGDHEIRNMVHRLTKSDVVSLFRNVQRTLDDGSESSSDGVADSEADLKTPRSDFIHLLGHSGKGHFHENCRESGCANCGNESEPRVEDNLYLFQGIILSVPPHHIRTEAQDDEE